MPQMAPLNWLSLFFMTITIMTMISTLMYFSFMKKISKKIMEQKIKNNWKW